MDSKVVVEIRLFDEKTDKENKFASCTVNVSSLIEDTCYFDIVEEKSVRFKSDNNTLTGAVGIRLLPSKNPSADDQPDSIGRLRMIVRRGKKICSSYPVYVSTGLTSVGAYKQRTTIANVPSDPVFDDVMEVDISSMQGDLMITLWEVHNVRSHKPIGQIILPLAWLANMSAVSRTGTDASLAGWFQILPRTKATSYNHGGQYRPYISGTPQSTGFGLKVPDKVQYIINLFIIDFH